MNLEEYEPESNPTDAGNPYVPAPVETQIENDEYEPELDNVNGESNYTPDRVVKITQQFPLPETF